MHRLAPAEIERIKAELPKHVGQLVLAHYIVELAKHLLEKNPSLKPAVHFQCGFLTSSVLIARQTSTGTRYQLPMMVHAHETAGTRVGSVGTVGTFTGAIDLEAAGSFTGCTFIFGTDAVIAWLKANRPQYQDSNKLGALIESLR